MAGNASRINGHKGGRPKGSENFDTKQRREMKNRWFTRIHNDADAIFDAHLTLAVGCYIEKQTPDGIQKVYKRPPDARSLQWIMEQVWGKPSEPSGLQDVPEEADSAVITKEMQRDIDRAIKYAVPESRWKTAK